MPSRNRQVQSMISKDILLGGVFLIVFFGLPGAFVGAIGLPQMLREHLGFECVWWQGMIIGFLIGIAAGMVQFFLKFGTKRRRSGGQAQPAKRVVPDPAEEKSLEDHIGMLTGTVAPQFDVIGQRKLKQSKITLGELTITPDPGRVFHKGDMQREKRQTAVVIENARLNIPEFSLQPKKKPGTLVAELMTRDKPAQEVTREFSSRYHLRGLETRLKKIFNNELLDLLLQQQIWEIHAASNRMVLFVPQQVYEGKHRKWFLQHAVQIAQVVERRCVALKETGKDPSISREKNETKIEKSIMPPATPFKNTAKNTWISRDEVQKFVAQARPRILPKALKKQTGPEVLFVFIGFVFILCAMVMLIGAQANADAALGLRMGAGAMFLLGPITLFLTSIFPRRKRELLRNGLVFSGRITNVESTGWVNGSRMMYRCHVEIVDGSKNRKLICWIDQDLAKRGQTLIDQKQTTSVLVSPSKPERCILPELMASF